LGHHLVQQGQVHQTLVEWEVTTPQEHVELKVKGQVEHVLAQGPTNQAMDHQVNQANQDFQGLTNRTTDLQTNQVKQDFQATNQTLDHQVQTLGNPALDSTLTKT